jgi:hypothetical protein
MFWVKLLSLFLPLAIWLCCRWKRETPTASDGVTLRYCSAARLAAWLIFVVGPIIPIGMALILADKRTPDRFLIFACCLAAAIVLAVGFYAWRETRVGHVVLLSDAVRRFSPWWGMTEVAWRQVAKAELTPRGTITLTSADGTRLKFIPSLWAQFDALCDAVDHHVAAGAIVH